MLKIKFFTALLYIKSLICPCKLEKEVPRNDIRPVYKTSMIGKLPASINESSAILTIDSSANPYNFITVNDHGGKPELYHVFRENNCWTYDSWKVSHARNMDWEELTSDDKGNIYIGDFGNNRNNRKDLKIYIVNPADRLKTDSITFNYEDQHAFPPSQKDLNFDCEAFFWLNEELYLFSKNRGDGPVKVYKLPAQPGDYQAKLIATLDIHEMITSADVSYNNKTIVLLSYGRIYFYKINFDQNIHFKAFYCRKFSRGGQSEGICFISKSDDLLITNEGRKIFWLRSK